MRACRRRAQQRHDADLHSREARASRAGRRRRGARADQQDVRRRRELLHPRRHDRLHSAARHQAQFGRAADGIRADLVELPEPGAAGARRPHRHQLLEQHADRSGGDGARASDRDCAVGAIERSPRASTSARTRIERSCISSSSPRRTRSISITTTPSRAPGTATYSTSCAPAARSRIRARRISTPAKISSGRSSKGADHGGKARRRNVTPQSEIVVFRFAPVKQGESMRIRMFETYTDTARYKVVERRVDLGSQLRPSVNAVVLPAGWVLTNSSIPATVTHDARRAHAPRLREPAPDEIAVLITARKRP